MANPQHIEWLLEGVEAWNARRAREEFEPDLSGARLSGADLRDANLERAKLEGAILRGADLRGVELAWAILSQAVLRGANVERAVLRGGKLERADLGWAIFTGTNLERADLTEADLEGAKLQNADLDWAILRQASLEMADLRGAVLREADLSGADLREANLKEANLRKANLREADVQTLYSFGGTLDEMTPKNIDLSKTRFLTQDQLNTMVGDRGAILPKGLVYPAHWPEPEPPEVPPSHELSPEYPAFEPNEQNAASMPLPAEATFQSITAPVDVIWTELGHLELDVAELIAVEPQPKRFIPTVSASAQMEQLAAVGALAKQIKTSIRTNASPNAASFVGDVCGIFEAIDREIHKPKGQVLIVLIKANIRALQELSANKEALSDVDKALFDAFMGEARTLLKLYPILQEIEDPHQSDLVSPDVEAEALAATQDLIEVLEAPETENALGPSLPGVTRDLATYPWDSNRKKIAVFAAYGSRILEALRNPPPWAKATAVWGTIISTILALLALL